MHLPGHNFTGPGTKLYKRLNPDGTPMEWSISINRVDNQLIITIFAIQNMMILKLGMRVCDKTMLGELKGIVNPTLKQRIGTSIVGKLINSKVNF